MAEEWTFKLRRRKIRGFLGVCGGGGVGQFCFCGSLSCKSSSSRVSLSCEIHILWKIVKGGWGGQRIRGARDMKFGVRTLPMIQFYGRTVRFLSFRLPKLAGARPGNWRAKGQRIQWAGRIEVAILVGIIVRTALEPPPRLCESRGPYGEGINFEEIGFAVEWYIFV